MLVRSKKEKRRQRWCRVFLPAESSFARSNLVTLAHAVSSPFKACRGDRDGGWDCTRREMEQREGVYGSSCAFRESVAAVTDLVSSSRAWQTAEAAGLLRAGCVSARPCPLSLALTAGQKGKRRVASTRRRRRVAAVCVLLTLSSARTGGAGRSNDRSVAVEGYRAHLHFQSWLPRHAWLFVTRRLVSYELGEHLCFLVNFATCLNRAG